MMNEEVDWYLKQIDELRNEFSQELSTGMLVVMSVGESEFNERVVECLQLMLLTEVQINKKYGVR